MAPPTKSKSSTNTRTRAKSNGNGDTTNKATTAKDDGLNRDKDGNLIDPPVIPEYEQRLLAANNSGDDLLIADVQNEYNEARTKLAREQADRDKRRQEADR